LAACAHQLEHIRYKVSICLRCSDNNFQFFVLSSSHRTNFFLEFGLGVGIRRDYLQRRVIRPRLSAYVQEHERGSHYNLILCFRYFKLIVGRKRVQFFQAEFLLGCWLAFWNFDLQKRMLMLNDILAFLADESSLLGGYLALKALVDNFLRG